MLEQQIDILSERVLTKAGAICFTSNGVVKRDGTLVMGAGVAKAFRDHFPGLDREAGDAVTSRGNVCQVVSRRHGIPIVAFPTKNHWKDPSDMPLIMRSAHRLMSLVRVEQWSLVALPRPGCRNGRLCWDEVRRAVCPVFDHHIVIVTRR